MITIDKKLLDAAEALTGSGYKIYVEEDTANTIIEELLDCYKKLEDKFVEYTQEVEENYIIKPTDLYMEHGVSECDFH